MDLVQLAVIAWRTVRAHSGLHHRFPMAAVRYARYVLINYHYPHSQLNATPSYPDGVILFIHFAAVEWWCHF